MRYLLFVVAFAFYTNIASAQLTKGNWLIGGNGKFYSSKEDFKIPPSISSSSKRIDINISSNIGYFVTDRLAFGLKPAVSFVKSKTIHSNTSNDKNLTIQKYLLGPFGRYYFLDKKRQSNILIDASYQFGTYSIYESRGKLRTFSIAAGPVIYFNSSVGIEFLVGYRYSFEAIDDAKRTNKGFQVGIGFQIHLKK